MARVLRIFEQRCWKTPNSVSLYLHNITIALALICHQTAAKLTKSLVTNIFLVMEYRVQNYLYLVGMLWAQNLKFSENFLILFIAFSV